MNNQHKNVNWVRLLASFLPELSTSETSQTNSITHPSSSKSIIARTREEVTATMRLLARERESLVATVRSAAERIKVIDKELVNLMSIRNKF